MGALALSPVRGTGTPSGFTRMDILRPLPILNFWSYSSENVKIFGINNESIKVTGFDIFNDSDKFLLYNLVCFFIEFLVYIL